MGLQGAPGRALVDDVVAQIERILHLAQGCRRTVVLGGAPAVVSGEDHERWRAATVSLRIRTGGDGPVAAEWERAVWRLIVRGHPHATGVNPDDLHAALRALALQDRDLAKDAFGVIVNCAGAWEDEYTEEHGVDALPFEYWLERIETELATAIDANGELYYYHA